MNFFLSRRLFFEEYHLVIRLKKNDYNIYKILRSLFKFKDMIDFGKENELNVNKLLIKDNSVYVSFTIVVCLSLRQKKIYYSSKGNNNYVVLLHQIYL